MLERIYIDRKNQKVFTEFHQNIDNPTEITEKTEFKPQADGTTLFETRIFEHHSRFDIQELGFRSGLQRLYRQMAFNKWEF